MGYWFWWATIPNTSLEWLKPHAVNLAENTNGSSF
jgi:hypothetical protein